MAYHHVDHCRVALRMLVGIVLTLIRTIPFRPCEWFVMLYVEYHRNVPLLVQIFVWYFGILQLLPRGARVWVNAHNSEFLAARPSRTRLAAGRVHLRRPAQRHPRHPEDAVRGRASIGFGFGRPCVGYPATGVPDVVPP